LKGERLGEFEELILLSVCTLGTNAYGVTIQETLQEQAERSVSIGAVYAALDRLERKGYVESWVGGATAERGGRRKRYFQATDSGVAALAEVRAVRERFWQGLKDLGLSGGLS
jgi:DNA-binding PadR family transcriptional regulator